MKIYIASLLLIFSLSSNLQAQWVSIGPPGGDVISLAINGNIVFAGTSYQGVFISSNNGMSSVSKLAEY